MRECCVKVLHRMKLEYLVNCIIDEKNGPQFKDELVARLRGRDERRGCSRAYNHPNFKLLWGALVDRVLLRSNGVLVTL